MQHHCPKPFRTFIAVKCASADQIEFVELVIEHLTEKGVMDPRLLYESPFKDIAPYRPEQVFSMKRAGELFDVIDRINLCAGEAVA